MQLPPSLAFIVRPFDPELPELLLLRFDFAVFGLLGCVIYPLPSTTPPRFSLGVLALERLVFITFSGLQLPL